MGICSIKQWICLLPPGPLSHLNSSTLPFVSILRNPLTLIWLSLTLFRLYCIFSMAPLKNCSIIAIFPSNSFLYFARNLHVTLAMINYS